MIKSFPLHYPADLARTPAHARRPGPCAVDGDAECVHLIREITLLGGENIIISSCAPLRPDGRRFTRAGLIAEPGIAVYFDRKGMTRTFACDQFWDMGHNIWVIRQSVEALRRRSPNRRANVGKNDRAKHRRKSGPRASSYQWSANWGTTPAHDQWFSILGIHPSATRQEIQHAWRTLAKGAHSDHGGCDRQMARINVARDQALAEMARA